MLCIVGAQKTGDWALECNGVGLWQTVVSGRTLNGQDAKAGAWPWQVSVQRYDSHICGGSLISKSWMVSAAHCFDPITVWLFPSRSTPEPAVPQRQVQVGENRIVSETPTQMFSSVKQVVLHRYYNSSTFLADIVLVELEKPIAFTASISPVCLLDASIHVPAGDACWVTGWGNIHPEASSSLAETLQELEVLTIDTTICNDHFREALQKSAGDNPIKEDMKCAGHIEGYKGTDPGDSGGPLVCDEDGTWYLAGIVSWLLKTTVNSVAAGYPGVYNRLNVHNNWIQENVPGVSFMVVNFTLNSASPSIAVTTNSAGSSASIPEVLLLTVLLWLTL
nr:serine protease 27-like [Chelonoidis abingdonii]